MRTILFALLFFAASMTRAAEPLRVVAETADLASIAQAVGGSRVTTAAIAAAGQDAHFIEAKPSFMVKLRDADLLVAVGMELAAGWEDPLLRGSRNERIQPGRPGYLDASTDVLKLEVPTGTIDRSRGDVHALGNPHYWLDPWNARQVAASIAARLTQLSPADAATFQANLAAFQQRLDSAMFGDALVKAVGGDALWTAELGGGVARALPALAASRPGLPPLGGWSARMAPLAGRSVITYHRSWSYFLTRFGLTLIGEIEPKPGIPPTPAHVLELIKLAQATKVGVVVAEPWYAKEAPELIAAKTGAPLLRLALSTGGNDPGDDYVAHEGRLVDAFATALGTTAPGHP